MSSLATAGLKKPLNMIEGPIYPDIKKGPPRFVWSKKAWKADSSVLLNTEPITQFIEPAILVQSRDYNQTVYGKSSHRDIVNANFRPPLLDPYEDNYALTRIPVTTRAIIPHINPGTADHGNGTSGYTSKNNFIESVKALTDRISTAGSRPTFFAPIEIPADNSVLPDLEAKMPSYSASAGWDIPIQMNAPNPEVVLSHNQLHPSGNSGYNPDMYITGENGKENLELRYNRPQTSVTSGYNAPDGFTRDAEIFGPELYENRPSISVNAGFDTPINLDAETRMPELTNNRPSVAVNAGFDTPISLDAETPNIHLSHNRPMVSVNAGFDTPISLDSEISSPHLEYNRPIGSVDSRKNMPYMHNAYNAIEDVVLDTKIDSVMNVNNPGSEFGYQERMYMHNSPEDYLQDKKPAYSYYVPQEIPTYRETNERSLKPHFRQKIETDKAYGQLSQSANYIPRMNDVSNLIVQLKQKTRGGKKVQYSIGK